MALGDGAANNYSNDNNKKFEDPTVYSPLIGQVSVSVRRVGVICVISQFPTVYSMTVVMH